MDCQKTDSFSGEVFKENFTDIFYTNLEQIAFSIAFPIKNSVKRKTSLFVEKKPKAKISLHIKIGDYLSSGDKIGEKESNIYEPHYVSLASQLRSTYKSFQVQTKDMRLPWCKSMIYDKSKMIDMHQSSALKQCETLRRYTIRARRSSTNALACKSSICKPCPCPSGKGKANKCKSKICKKICKPCTLVKSQQIGPNTSLNLYGHQLKASTKLWTCFCFAKRFARKWDSIRFANQRLSFASPLVKSWQISLQGHGRNQRTVALEAMQLYKNIMPMQSFALQKQRKKMAANFLAKDNLQRLSLARKFVKPSVGVQVQSKALQFDLQGQGQSEFTLVHGPSSSYKSTAQIGRTIAPTVPRRFVSTRLDLRRHAFQARLASASAKQSFAIRYARRFVRGCKGKSLPKRQKNIRTPLVLTSSGRVVMINKNQLVLQKTQPVLFYDSANLHVKKGEFVLQGAPLLTLTHQTLITGDIVQGIPRIEQLFEAFTSPQKGLKDKKRLNVHDTLHSQVRDIFRKNWLKNVLSVAVRKSLEEIGSILLEMIQKVYLSQGVLISDKHIEIIIRQMTSKGQILDSGSTGLLLEEVLPIRQIENANITTPGKKCLYVPSVVGLTAAALTCDSFISAASFQETTRVLSRDAVVGKTDFLRGLKEKVVIGDLISAGTGLDIYFVYTLFSESITYVQQSKPVSQ